MYILEGHTPDTTNYMILGYAVIFVVMGLYVWSLKSRRKNFENDLDLISKMDD